MSDVYAYIKDKNNNVVHTIVKRIETASVTSTFLADAIDDNAVKAYFNENHSVEVVAQFANGNRQTLYTGTLK